MSLLRGLAVPHWRAEREAGAQFYGFLGEQLSGTEDIRANGARDYVMGRFYKQNQVWLKHRVRAFVSNSMMTMSSLLTFAIADAIAFALGAWLWHKGQISIGTVYVLFYYTELLRRPIEQIRTQLQELQTATASIGRVEELMATESKVHDGPGASFPAGALSLDFDAVSFSYEDAEPVLRDLSFRLEPGQVLGLLGRTGSGKTTLARLVFRLYDPDAGVLRLGDVAIREARLDDLRGRVGMVTQDVQIFNATVRENLAFFDATVSDERLLGVIEEIGLTSWLATQPSGLDTQIAAGGLSAGEAQLLAFARLFLADPGLVILDEASSRLDPATERLIERAVSKLLAGRTGILIAHRLATVERADQVLILDDGRVAEMGVRAELAADPASRFSRAAAERPAGGAGVKTYQYIWRMVMARPWLYSLNAVLWTLIHVGPLVPGLILRDYFNALTNEQAARFSVTTLIIFMVAQGVARCVLNLCGMVADIYHRFSMSALLRRNLLERILERPGARAIPVSPGEAISSFRDDAQYAEDCVDWTLDVIGSAVFAVAVVVVLLAINPWITLFVFVPLTAVVGAAQAMSNRMERYRRASRTATGDVTSAIGEAFAGVQAVQVAGAEANVLANFRRLSEARGATMIKDRVYTQGFQSVYANTVNIGTGLILILAAQSMRSGSLTVGDFALFVYYLGFVTDFVSFLGRFLTTYKQTAVSFVRLAGLMQGATAGRLVQAHKLHLSGPVPEPAPLSRAEHDRLEDLTISGLTYRYPESGRGIEGIDLRVARGEFVVVTGRIGSGKTTLLRAILGLLTRTRAPSPGTGRASSTPPTSLRRHAAPTRRNCRSYSAPRYGTTSFWVSRRTGTWSGRCAKRRWSETSPSWPWASKRLLARAA